MSYPNFLLQQKICQHRKENDAHPHQMLAFLGLCIKKIKLAPIYIIIHFSMSLCKHEHLPKLQADETLEVFGRQRDMSLPSWPTLLCSWAKLRVCALLCEHSWSILLSTASRRWVRDPKVSFSKRFISVWWDTRNRSRAPSCSPDGPACRGSLNLPSAKEMLIKSSAL